MAMQGAISSAAMALTFLSEYSVSEPEELNFLVFGNVCGST